MNEKSATAPLDRRIAQTAGGQHGMIAHRQLRALGLGPGGIDKRVRSGRLHPHHRGVYSVGHDVTTQEGRWMAAVLALGPTAVLSHRSAAALWELRASPVVEVTVPGDGGRRRRDGILLHRSKTLTELDVTTHRGIPVTTPARTLVDYAEVVARRTLERALDEAEVTLRLDWRTVDDVLARHPGRVGAKRLRAAIERHDIGSSRSRSELEEAVLALCDRAGLPRPRMNVQLAGMEVDFWWPEHRLVVEADSRRHHHTAAAFERDRLRDAELVVEGIRVIRLTHRRVVHDEVAVAALLSRLLAPAQLPAPHRVA